MIVISQDKTMIFNFNNIETIGIGNPLENIDSRFIILAETTSDNQYPIAEYKTERRAKEVLQEIIEEYRNCNSSFGHEGYVKNRIYYIPEE